MPVAYANRVSTSVFLLSAVIIVISCRTFQPAPKSGISVYDSLVFQSLGTAARFMLCHNTKSFTIQTQWMFIRGFKTGDLEGFQPCLSDSGRINLLKLTGLDFIIRLLLHWRFDLNRKSCDQRITRMNSTCTSKPFMSVTKLATNGENREIGSNSWWWWNLQGWFLVWVGWRGA